MKLKNTTVFIIREIETGKLIKFGSKCGWTSSMAAKNAFNLHMKHYFGKVFADDTKGLFERQSEFQIEEIK